MGFNGLLAGDESGFVFGAAAATRCCGAARRVHKAVMASRRGSRGAASALQQQHTNGHDEVTRRRPVSASRLQLLRRARSGIISGRRWCAQKAGRGRGMGHGWVASGWGASNARGRIGAG
jgi:hypothetical protein